MVQRVVAKHLKSDLLKPEPERWVMLLWLIPTAEMLLLNNGHTFWPEGFYENQRCCTWRKIIADDQNSHILSLLQQYSHTRKYRINRNTTSCWQINMCTLTTPLLLEIHMLSIDANKKYFLRETFLELCSGTVSQNLLNMRELKKKKIQLVWCDPCLHKPLDPQLGWKEKLIKSFIQTKSSLGAKLQGV